MSTILFFILVGGAIASHPVNETVELSWDMLAAIWPLLVVLGGMLICMITASWWAPDTE